MRALVVFAHPVESSYNAIRKQMTRAVRWYCHPSARCRYLALYDMNSATEAKRKAFLARVERAMAAF